MGYSVSAAGKQGERWKSEGAEIGWGMVSAYWEGRQEGDRGGGFAQNKGLFSV